MSYHAQTFTKVPSSWIPAFSSKMEVWESLRKSVETTANGPGISYHYNRIYVRIDNVMCSNDWHPYNFTVDRSINVSDHYPLWGFVKKSLHNDKKTH